jgi:Ca-activated chloride channel family protein
MRLADLWFLVILAFIPLYLWLTIFHRRREASIRYSDLGNVRKVKGTRSVRYRRVLIFLRGLALSLMVVALARPQAGRKSEEILTKGIDIVLTLDVSTSMRAEDFKPNNRLWVAKEVAKDFIRGRRNDRIGLVIFAGKSFTQCPLTLDYGVLLDFLDRVEIGMVEDGTAIGMGLATAINRLRESQAKSKVVILLTDGRNNRGEIDPVTAAKAAQPLGIKIYTIGAGKRGSAPYPIEDPIFGKRYVRLPVEIDEKTLEEVARTTGGRYFRATDAQKLSAIYEEISQMEKTKIKTREYMEYSERFGRFLFPALLFLMIEIVLANTRFRKIP